jgi:hypothetical protein
VSFGAQFIQITVQRIDKAVVVVDDKDARHDATTTD